MTKDDEIRQGLRNAGVPEMVFGTTLLREEAPELRELITSQSLVRPSSARGLFLYPKAKGTTGKARKLFYLVAKELFLSGVTVFCIPLTRLMETLTSFDDINGDASRLERVRVVFILDFYEEGAGFPFSTQDAARLRAWVRQRFEAGNAVSFLSDSAPERSLPWWPQSFMGFIHDHTAVHAV